MSNVGSILIGRVEEETCSCRDGPNDFINVFTFNVTDLESPSRCEDLVKDTLRAVVESAEHDKEETGTSLAGYR